MQMDKGREIKRWDLCSHKGITKKSMGRATIETAKQALEKIIGFADEGPAGVDALSRRPGVK